MAIAQTTVSNSLSSIYTSGGSTAITVIFFMNNGSSDVTISVAVADAATAALGPLSIAANGILKDVTIAAGDTYILDVEKFVLENGDEIHAVATTAGDVVATMTYAEL